MSPTTMYANAQEAKTFTSSILEKAGLSAEDASTMAACLVQADLRGVSSHGLARLEQYTTRARSGLVNTKPNIVTRQITPVAVQVDGDNGFGFVVATLAMKEAIQRAQTYGIAIATVKRSNHFGMAASYILQAIEAGMMAFVFSNASKNMPAFGSKEPLFGTSPFATGAPSGDEIPFILDMAPSVVAKGKIRVAARNGRTIPEGWAVDENGKPTTDPIAAIKGMVVPIGGPKGSGIAMLMDVMSGVLSGSAFAGEVGDQYRDERPQNVGHCFIVINPELFLEPGEVRTRMDTLVRKVHASHPADGVKEVFAPGEPEYRMAEARSHEGIPFGEVERQMLNNVAARFSVPDLKFSPVPFHIASNGSAQH